MSTTLQRVRRSNRGLAIDSRYLGNNPTNATDPSGLVESLAIDRRLLREQERRERKEAREREEALIAKQGPEDWEQIIAAGAKNGRQQGYGLWAEVLEHFLIPKENGKDTRQNPYIMPAALKPEAELHSRSLIESMLGFEYARWRGVPAPTVGEQVNINNRKVRWVSTDLALGLFEDKFKKEFDKWPDEHMFRAYGGAVLSINGVITGYDPKTGWTLKANVTILDNADFAPGGLRLAFSGKLADIYVAGHKLQAWKATQQPEIRLSYWHKISFTAEYTIKPEIVNPRDLKLMDD